MATHCGYVVEVKEIRKHNNADRLQIATFFGNDTCVGLDVKAGDIGIYFPCDLQLGITYCDSNHLCRTDANGNKDTGYLEREKRNIKAIKLRGEKSEGLYMPLTSLSEFGSIEELKIGNTIDVFNGVEICRKYIPRSNQRAHSSTGKKGKATKVDIAPLFLEHIDTEQLVYNLSDFKQNDIVEITLKLHGTSQRTGYLPVFKKYKKTIIDRLLGRTGKPVYEWDYVSGTRRTVLSDYQGGYYGSNEFREPHSKFFEGKLHKGETVYYEVVGFTKDGRPIMGSVNNKSVNDKEFVKTYGDTTVFSYGCDPLGKDAPQSDIYVYRMTMTNEDGDVVDYSPEFMRYRCEQMGVKTVPVLEYFQIPGYYTDDNAGECVKDIAELVYDGADPIGVTHIREGVVVRIVNRPGFKVYKHKNFFFKVLSGIIVDNSANIETAEISEDVLSEL